MAIKPTDIIVYLDEVGYWQEETVWWNDEKKEKVYHRPKYWQNFYLHATKNLKIQATVRLHDQAIEQGLKPYKAEYKESKARGPYLKFKTQSAYTFFMLKWG